MKVTRRIRGQCDLLAEMTGSLPRPEGGQVLDIGTGSGLAARAFHDAGWSVAATGFDIESYVEDSDPLPEAVKLHRDVDVRRMDAFADGQFDVVWCAHVLEHVLDTGLALAEIRRVLKPEGRLLVSVPPFKHAVVGGHVHAGWNIGYLMYVLAVAGFGLRDGRFVKHGYNIFGQVTRGPGPLEGLRFANGDLEMLRDAGRFPEGFDASQGFDGDRDKVNWVWNVPPTELPLPQHTSAGQHRRLRIGFFVPWITKGRGGTENVGHMMANAMAARGHDVTVFTFEERTDAAPRWPLDPAIRLICLPEVDDDRSDDQMTMQVASTNRELLVGLHMNRTFVRYVRCAHRLGLPIVLSEHIDPRMPDWIGTFSTEERVAAFAGASHLHVLTDTMKATLPEPLQDRVRVVPNTVPDTDERADPGKTDGPRIVLTVARLVPRKNIALLLKAFAEAAPGNPDWNLRIVGDGPERDALERLAAQLAIEDRVEFIGETDDPYPFYRDAHLFAVPSTIEGFSLVTCEAIAHGLPVVGYRCCNGVNDQVVHGQTGLLSTGGRMIGSFRRDLARLMADDALRARMGAAGRARFEELYSAQAVVPAWERLFIEAAQTPLPQSKIHRAARRTARLEELVWGRLPVSDPTLF
mgnify:CR=1 FL=1